jgi:hypothetical protein
MPSRPFAALNGCAHATKDFLCMPESRIADNDRDALERLCRYGARPALRRTGSRGPTTAASRIG